MSSISTGGHAKPVVLIGFMASGKSKIGARLAARLNLPFVDTDQRIEKLFGMTIAEIFRREGERSFREAERKVILDLLPGGRRVIAAGGGAFIDPELRASLTAKALTIWLDPPFVTVLARLARSHERPLASALSDQELHDLWTKRRVYYAKAHVRIESRDDDPGLIVEAIVERLSSS